MNLLQALVRKVVNSWTVSLFRLSKDHYDAFTNPELELKVAELGVDEVFIIGLVDKVCIYLNALAFLERGFLTNVVKGCTAPFDLKKRREALEELGACGAKVADDVPEDIGVILLLFSFSHSISSPSQSGSI